MTDDPVTIIRASALSGYPDCPRRGAARLFRRQIEAAGYRLGRIGRGIGAAIGTAVHKGAEVALAEKAKTGSLPPVDVSLDAANDSLGEQLTGGEINFDGPNGLSHNRKEALSQTLAMTSSYRRLVAPEIEPISVEVRLEAEFVAGIVLSGQPDVVAFERTAVRDLKSGGRQPRSVAPQIGAYSLLCRSHSLDIQEARIDFVQRVGAGKPQPDPVSATIELAHAETAAMSLLLHMTSDLDTFENGNSNMPAGDPWAFVANPASTLCSAKWCPAHGTEFCHEGKQ
jgi:hypothetical protein